MHDFALTTPVAFVIFNRPDTTAKVFAEIAKARPPMLLVVGDGPRVNRAGEAERVAQTRAIVDQVDWPCTVLTNFSDVNLGCRQRVSSGLDWVFNQVEEAIVLEDDCLPDPSFFQFCQEMLEHYRNDQRIGMISGDNFQFGKRYGDDSYYFSKYVHIWGWASWRDRWQGAYDVNLARWPEIRDDGRVVDLVLNQTEEKYWRKVFERVYRGDIDTWDYQWLFANLAEGRLSILPSVNLISNIGFGEGATHTVGLSDEANMQRRSMEFPLRHPIVRMRNSAADRFTDRRCIRKPLWKQVYGKLAHQIFTRRIKAR